MLAHGRSIRIGYQPRGATLLSKLWIILIPTGALAQRSLSRALLSMLGTRPERTVSTMRKLGTDNYSSRGGGTESMVQL